MRLPFFVLVLLLLHFVSGAFGAPLKNFPLVNQEGKPFQLHDLKGSYVILTFVYSRCPVQSMCPLSLKLTRQTMKAWSQHPALKGKKLVSLSVTLDPENDSPNVLKNYGKKFSLAAPDSWLATGDPKVLSELGSEFNVVGFPSGATVSHNSKHILLDPELNTVAEMKDNEWKIDDLISKAVADISKPKK